mmetsp:Transcript_47717/g.94835  ORF Transcript_47717/g.94835 Transcript_47717/m.94835 type:complete len:98 (-) Transcript_47717:348-641(-)
MFVEHTAAVLGTAITPMVATDEGIRPITGASVPTYIFASVFDLHGVADCCCGFMGASFTVEVVHLLDMAAAVLPAARGVMALASFGLCPTTVASLRL